MSGFCCKFRERGRCVVEFAEGGGVADADAEERGDGGDGEGCWD